MVRENCLYSVNHVLNKTLIGQARGVGRKTRQEVEMMQGEQENSEEEEVDSSHSCPDHRSSRMWAAPLKKVLSHMTKIDEKNGLIKIWELANKKPDLKGQSGL